MSKKTKSNPPEFDKNSIKIPIVPTHRVARVLVADDDEEIVNVISSLLEKNGYQVLRAMSGYDALGLILGEFKGEIDVVLTDLHMPNGSGLSLLEALRKMDQTLPVFFMTGDPTIDVDKMRARGAAGVISKPLHNVSLLAALSAALKGSLAQPRKKSA